MAIIKGIIMGMGSLFGGRRKIHEKVLAPDPVTHDAVAVTHDAVAVTHGLA